MGKATLTEFFRTLDRRILALTGEGDTSFQVSVCGQVIEQRFITAEHAETVSRYMVGMMPETPRTPDAVFYYWTEDTSHYLPAVASDAPAVWQSRDETGYFRLTPNYGMIGIDYSRNVYYYCRHPSDSTQHMLYGHAMIVCFGQWARSNGMLLLHSACVGVGGKGVMISARGGGGESTLAVSCLLDGFDFVADDYILVNRDGPLRAMPLYRTVGLNQDMAALLRPDMPIVHKDPTRDDKLLLDASRYSFQPELPVSAILFPRVSGENEPAIRPAAPGPVLTRLIDSTATQTGVLRDPEPYRLMAQRLLGLPVYEISLCRDLEKNRELLKIFSQKEL